MSTSNRGSNGVGATAADNNISNLFAGKTAAQKAAILAQLQSTIDDDLAAREPALNEAYKNVLDLLKPMQQEFPGYTPYWLIPQGLAYKIAEFLQTKAKRFENGSATQDEIVEALTAQHMDEDQVLECLTKRSGDGKNDAKRDLWTFDNKSKTYTLLKPFKTEKK